MTIQALLKAGRKRGAAIFCLELVRRGVGFTEVERQVLFAQGKELAAQTGCWDKLLTVINKRAGELEPGDKFTLLQCEGDFFAGHGAYAGARGLYEQAAELTRVVSSEQIITLAAKLALVYEKVGDQLVRMTDRKTEARTAYQNALNLWRKVENETRMRDCQLKAAEIMSGEAAADAKAPGHAPLAPPPVLAQEPESAERIAEIATRLRRTIPTAKSLIGQGQYLRAFDELDDVRIAMEVKYALIESNEATRNLLAEYWTLCGKAGLAALEDKKNETKPNAALVVTALRRAQKLGVRDLDDTSSLQYIIDYIIKDRRDFWREEA